MSCGKEAVPSACLGLLEIVWLCPGRGLCSLSSAAVLGPPRGNGQRHRQGRPAPSGESGFTGPVAWGPGAKGSSRGSGGGPGPAGLPLSPHMVLGWGLPQEWGAPGPIELSPDLCRPGTSRLAPASFLLLPSFDNVKSEAGVPPSPPQLPIQLPPLPTREILPGEPFLFQRPWHLGLDRYKAGPAEGGLLGRGHLWWAAGLRLELRASDSESSALLPTPHCL